MINCTGCFGACQYHLLQVRRSLSRQFVYILCFSTRQCPAICFAFWRGFFKCKHYGFIRHNARYSYRGNFEHSANTFSCIVSMAFSPCCTISAMNEAIKSISSSFMPRVCHRRRADAYAAGHGGLLWIKGNRVFVRGDVRIVQQVFQDVFPSSRFCERSNSIR